MTFTGWEQTKSFKNKDPKLVVIQRNFHSELKSCWLGVLTTIASPLKKSRDFWRSSNIILRPRWSDAKKRTSNLSNQESKASVEVNSVS